ncbi:hypothetical protein [Massilia sp. YIM B04103]|uniref:hypothetical protein n=1 Tax=Massilia sp. YIM B04103 TaxID=2963106 RepID=UPI00210E33F2|nr:hypothetical protein [Massilia sp. YIM B04103]
MNLFYLARRNAFVMTLFAPVVAQAARPMAADDASILDAGHCQLESWSQRTSAQTEFWAMPACRVGSWELGAGTGRLQEREGAQARTRSHMLQAKTLFRPLSTNSWGAGLVLAEQFHSGDHGQGDLSLNLPISFSFQGDAVLLHANAGWLRERTAHRGGATWALGAEFAVTPKTALTLESFGSRFGHSYVQAGVRHTLIQDRLDIDASYGERLGWRGKERIFAIGLTLAGPALH